MPQVMKIYGSPGTGKTTFLMDLFQRELEKGVPTERIGFFTFTKAARLEAYQRLNMSEKQLPHVRTIHSACYRQLQVASGELVGHKDLRFFGQQIGVQLSGYSGSPWASWEEGEDLPSEPSKEDRLLVVNHLGRHRLQMLKTALIDAPWELDLAYSRWFTRAYKDWKKAEGRLDFTDLLTHYIASEQHHPLDIDVLFVDEAQDLSKLQWQAVAKLGANAARWYVAGDDDQAIFSWAGADVESFLNLAGEVQVLPLSHRLPQKVWQVALSVADRIQHRAPKSWKPRDEMGLVENVAGINYEDLQEDSLVLYRNHYRSRELAEALKRERVPFLGPHSPLSKPHTLDALRALHDWSTGVPTTPARAWSLVQHLEIKCLAPGAAQKAQGNIPLYKDDILSWKGDNLWMSTSCWNWYGGMYDFVAMLLKNQEDISRVLAPRVRLSSIHQVKGHEAKTVVLDLERAGKTWNGALLNPDDEHRVWYVGVTRAKERLLVLPAEGPRAYQL